MQPNKQARPGGLYAKEQKFPPADGMQWAGGLVGWWDVKMAGLGEW